MTKYNKYQNGAEAQPIDYSSFGFIQPETLENMFVSQEQDDASNDDYAYEEDPTYNPVESEESELSLLREQNEILQKTLDEYKNMQQSVDEDIEIDQFINFLNTEENTPLDPDEMESEYYNYKTAQFEQAAAVALDSITPKKYLEAIFGTEAGVTGQKTQLKGSASGRYQIIEGTRKGIYNKYYKNSGISYNDFTNKYNTDPEFEQGVAEALAGELINNSSTIDEAIGKWYSPASVAKGLWDQIPAASSGNKLTLREYVNKTKRNLPARQSGGFIPTAILPEDQRTGLNNSHYNEMLFNTEGYNQFRGLDNFDPVYIVDENNKQRVLIGPNQTSTFQGKVFEQNLNKFRKGGKKKNKKTWYY